ncbi:TlpA family protein disulfide reductase [Bizionia gelidisalsuginis]|uniref:TlpA family protein disulfide reductase n=1 Tax=Bizionia gelidisalsuginis TaxID=291188 RepID=A0ABY3M9W9_9FLAO|nr:TlpA disulfide reductase family protein [Bizionia gelidisalsuginis]TYC12071.1 TlpA family protein disulfide reductase [Bizionia gelidisalsuginis]
MRNLILIALVSLMVSCNKEVPKKDYAVLYGTVENPNDSINLRLFNPVSSKSVIIDVDENGNFRDTLKLENPVNYNTVYDKVFEVYLQNDMDLNMSFDASNIQETLTFKGKGAEENNFIKFKTGHLSSLFGKDYKEYLGAEETDFNARTDAFMTTFYATLDNKEALLDSTFVADEKKKIEEFKTGMVAQHEQQLEINSKLGKGLPSPEFTDYVNYKGGTSSLSDFKGSYVYIDVWATWCVPCIYEMPYLAKVEEAFKDKNITFLSISVDNQKDKAKWRKMIETKALDGVQLLADNATESKFMTDYYIFGIPRFILLDKEGNIVSYDAPRPSEEGLKDLFNSLDI